MKTKSKETKSLLRTRGQMWSLLGASNEKRGNYEESTKYYNKALTNCLNIKDKLGEAVIYNNLARIMEKKKKFSVAKKFYKDTLKILTDLKDKKIKCGSLYNYAELLRKLREYDGSLKQFKKAFIIFSELLDNDSMGKVLYKIGKIYRLKKDYQKALNFQLESMKIIKIDESESILTDEPVLQILALKTRRELGLIFLMKGEIKLSLKYFGDALRIAFKSVGKGRRTGKILLDVSKVYDYILKFELALKYYKFALDDFEKVKDKYEISNIYNFIGEVYSSMKNFVKALENFQTSLYMKKEIGFKIRKRDVHITRVLINIGLVYRLRKMHREALEYFSKALKMLQEMGDRQGESATLNNIGIVYDSMKQYQQALKHFEKSLELCKVLKNYNGRGTIINNIGSIHLSLGDMAKSLQFYLDAYEIFGKIKNQFRKATTGYNLAFFFYCLEKFEKSKNFLERSLKFFKIGKYDVESLESKNFLQVIKTKIERGNQENIWNYFSNKNTKITLKDFKILEQIKKKSGGDKYYSVLEGIVYVVKHKKFPGKMVMKLVDLDYSKTQSEKENLIDNIFHPHLLLEYCHFISKVDVKKFPGIISKRAVFHIFPLYCCNLKEKLEKIELNEMIYLNYTRQLVDGLFYIFNKGIIHNNIKVEEIFVSPAGNLLIGGFGKHFNAKQDKNKRFTDVCSLGVLCYNVLMRISSKENVSVETRKFVLKMIEPNYDKIDIKSAKEEVENLLETKLCIQKNNILI